MTFPPEVWSGVLRRLEEMLPDRWAAAHPEAILNHRLDESRTKAVRTRARRAHRRARRK